MSSNADGLPWLDEPSPSAAPRVSPRSMLPWYLLFGVLMVAVVAGTWWIVTRREAPPPQLPIEALPLDQPAAAERTAEANPSPAEPRPEAEPQRAPPFERAAEPRTIGQEQRDTASPRPQPTRRAEVAAKAIRRVKEQSPNFSTLPDETQPMFYRTEPNRGRVVQLGAFPTTSEADEAWRKLTRRYPYLATKPKLVSPVEVRALGGGRRTKLYRLQLATASQAQSVVICQQLERAGQSCVVVY